MKRIILTTVLALITIVELIACTCQPPYYLNFYDAITKHPLFVQSSSNIVKAKIISLSDDYYFMNVEVLEELTGNLNLLSVTVSGQDGMNCAVSLGNGYFHPNYTVIMFLTPDFYGRADTLELNDCSVSYLKYSNNKVLGNITSTQTEMDYPEFKELIQNYTSSIEIDTWLNENPITVSPNPNPGKFLVQFNSLVGQHFSILLTDAFGRRIELREILATSQNFIESYNILSLEEGIYFMTVFSDNLCLTQKIVFRK